MEKKYNRRSWQESVESLKNRKKVFEERLVSKKPFFSKYFGWLNFINVFRYIKTLDWYIIKKFIGTYIFSSEFSIFFFIK